MFFGSNFFFKLVIFLFFIGFLIYVLSNEYYVVNEEIVVVFCFFSVWVVLIKFGGFVYKEWVEG